MKIFITGAQGFIGSHLYHYLKSKGHQVRGIDNLSHPSSNPGVLFDYGDVRYFHDIEPYVKWCDVVCHLAAQIHVDKSITNPQETIDVNVGGTLNILEAARKFNKRVVFASTSEVYGTSQQNWMNEKHQLDCMSPYGASKVAGDRLCKSYYDTYGLDVRILRNFNTFGPYQNDGSYGGVIAIFTRKALNGEPLTIFGEGNQERDYMYIDDAIKGYEVCLFNDDLKGQVLNVGSGRTITINSLAKDIVDITKTKSKITHVSPRPGEVMRLCADITKAKKYGYKPSGTFKDHLRNYISWYQGQRKDGVK